MTDEPIRCSKAVIEALRAAVERYPDQRVAQLIVNATNRSDPFYVEDPDLAAALWGYGDSDD